MRYLLPIILCLFLSVPSFAGPEDSVQKIVEDYKQVELLLKSGGINQVKHKDLLIELHARAKFQVKKEFYEQRKAAGILRHGETIEEQKYGLEDPNLKYNETYLLFLQILRGFQETPT